MGTLARNGLNRGARYGLEIPVIYTLNGHEKAIEWMKSKIQEDIKLETTKYEKSLFKTK